MQHLQGRPDLRPLPAADRAAVARALSKVPEDRFPSCSDFIHAYVAAECAAVQAGLAALGAVPAGDAFWRFQTVYGLLWPRGYQVHAQGLTWYNPFAEAPAPAREILLDLLHAGEEVVPLVPGWETQAADALRVRGAVRLTAAPEDRGALKDAILRLA